MLSSQKKETMKISLILTAFIVLELTTNIHGVCNLAGRKRLRCTDFNENFLTYSSEHGNVTHVSLIGGFSEIGFDSRFTKLLSVDIIREQLFSFKMDYLNNLTSLTHLTVKPCRSIDLNVVGKINNFKHLEFIQLTRLKYIPGSFTSFVNLKTIILNGYDVLYFDFNLLPNSLKVLKITSVRKMRLVNEISLKRLPRLTELNLEFSQTTLNASFIPSCLKILSIKNLISQKDLVGTNIIKLKIYKSQTPLKFIPTNLRSLWLTFTDLKVTCENLRQSKIENLFIKTGITWTDVRNNATESLLKLQYYNLYHKNCTIPEMQVETVIRSQIF